MEVYHYYNLNQLKGIYFASNSIVLLVNETWKTKAYNMADVESEEARLL
jgi:hypothetical protein